MIESKSVTVNFAPPLCSMLLVLFIALKLCGVIDWGWVWVLSPIWLPFVISLGLLGVICSVVGIAAGFVFLIEWLSEKK